MNESSDDHSEMVRILAHLTDDPNSPDENGWTPIYWATSNRHVKLSKYWFNGQTILILLQINGR